MCTIAKVRILNVDSNNFTRHTRSQILLAAGFAVTEALTGNEALQVLTVEIPQLVLINLDLSDIDGFDLARQIKDNYICVTIPLILLTAFASSQERVRGLENGADVCLVEPVAAAELIATVNALLLVRSKLANELSFTLNKLCSIRNKLAMVVERIATEKCKETANYKNDSSVELSGLEKREISVHPTIDSVLYPTEVISNSSSTLDNITECKPREKYKHYTQQFLKKLIAGDAEVVLLKQQLQQAETEKEELAAYKIEITSLKQQLQQAETEKEELAAYKIEITNLKQQLQQEITKPRQMESEKEELAAGDSEITSLKQQLQEEITKRQQVEAEKEELAALFQETRQQLEAVKRFQERLLSDICHQLRSPLVPIIGWANLLQTQKFNAETTAKALKAIEKYASLEKHLIDDLSAFSHLQQTKIRPSKSPINLSSIVNSVSKTVWDEILEKSIEFKFLPKSSALVSGDINSLQKIALYLLTNAIESTPAQGIIEVQLEQINGYAQLEISNTGQGIASDCLPYVFDLFSRLNTPYDRKCGELKIGLAIAHHLVKLHEGTLEVTSPGEGQGTTFTVKLPLSSEQIITID